MEKRKTRQKIRSAIILVSFLLFPITIDYFSPYIIIDGSSNGIINGSLITFGLLFFFSLFLGRAWCGWVCPMAGMQEMCFPAQDKKARGGKFDWIKYFIWVPWLGIIAFLATKAGGYHEVNPFYLIEHGISAAKPDDEAIYFWVIYFIVVSLFLILALATGRRGGCHYICWMAPFMVIGTRIKNLFGWPSLHLKVNKEKCANCKTCSKNCPMSLDVNAMVQKGSMENSECILCGTCADNCPKGVITYSYSSPQKKERLKLSP